MSRALLMTLCLITQFARLGVLNKRKKNENEKKKLKEKRKKSANKPYQRHFCATLMGTLVRRVFCPDHAYFHSHR